MPRNTDTSPAETPPSTSQPASPDVSWYAEALFFAYREFTAEPDRILHDIGFGRAHHRVLFFVGRYPGLRVADLLGILQITKQSLSRVLRELVTKGYIQQEAGLQDRRERLLSVTGKGDELLRQLADSQFKRLQAGLDAAAPEAGAVARFLEAMIGNARNLPHNQSGQTRQNGDETAAGKR